MFHLFPEGGFGLDGQVPVHRNRVMNGGDGGYHAIDGEEPVRKTLVIVDHIIVAPPVPKEPIGPEPEGEWLRKTHGADPEPFDEIDGVEKLPKGRDPEKVLGIVKIETGNFVHRHAMVQERVRWPGHHLHMVPEFFEGYGQVLEVDPLAATMGVAPVTEQANS